MPRGSPSSGATAQIALTTLAQLDDGSLMGQQRNLPREFGVRHSEEFGEIIAYEPNGLVRWGIMAIFATLVAAVVLSWFVRYPIVVTGESVLTTSAPPVRLVARVGGEIRQLFVRDADRVAAGAALALISNPADYGDVQELRGELAALERAIAGASRLSDALLRPQPTLGDIQASYLELQQRLSDYRSSDFDVFNAAKVAALRSEIATLQRQQEILGRQQRISAQELEVAQRQPTRYRQLTERQGKPLTDAERQVMSPTEIDQAEAQYLQRRLAVEQSASSYEGIGAQLASRRGALVDLEQQQRDAQRNRLLALQTALAAVRVAVAKWEEQYVIRAPVEGRVAFFRVLVPHEFVTAAEPLVAVIPGSDSGTVIGRVLLADANAGRVRVGQRVVLRLDGFPASDFGTLSGRVERISMLPTEHPVGRDQPAEIVHLVEVSLPDGLRTSHGDVIAFRQEMHGSADLITDDVRLLERMFVQLRDIAHRTAHG